MGNPHGTDGTESIGMAKLFRISMGTSRNWSHLIPFCMVESYKISLERIKLVKILLGMAEVYRIPLGVVELVKIPLGTAQVFRISFWTGEIHKNFFFGIA